MTHEEILAMLGDYVDYLIANSSAEAPMWNIEKVRSGKPNKWNYIDGCMITACLSLYKTTGDEKYLSFSKDFIDFFVQEDGSIKTYDPKEYNLDNVNQGKNLFTLYDIFGDEKYRRAIDTIRSQLLTQPRTKEGNFWHKDIYPWQVWLDGTYMAQPFYMEYETRYNKMQGCIDSYKQFMNIEKHMRDEKTGLYYHGYDESRQMYWADPVTGCSPNFWLRAMGWFMVAMVDVLERMDEQLYNEYRGIMAMLKQTIEDVHKFQDEETGMFWQVMDHPGRGGQLSGDQRHCPVCLRGAQGRAPGLPAQTDGCLGRESLLRHLRQVPVQESGRQPAAGRHLPGGRSGRQGPPRRLFGLLLQRAGGLQRCQGCRPAGAGLHRNDRTQVNCISWAGSFLAGHESGHSIARGAVAKQRLFKMLKTAAFTVQNGQNAENSKADLQKKNEIGSPFRGSLSHFFCWGCFATAPSLWKEVQHEFSKMSYQNLNRFTMRCHRRVKILPSFTVSVTAAVVSAAATVSAVL